MNKSGAANGLNWRGPSARWPSCLPSNLCKRISTDFLKTEFSVTYSHSPHINSPSSVLQADIFVNASKSSFLASFGDGIANNEVEGPNEAEAFPAVDAGVAVLPFRFVPCGARFDGVTSLPRFWTRWDRLVGRVRVCSTSILSDPTAGPQKAACADRQCSRNSAGLAVGSKESGGRCSSGLC